MNNPLAPKASVGALCFVTLPTSYSVPWVVVLLCTYLMASWSAVESHLSVMTEAPVLPRAGASSWSARSGAPHPWPLAVGELLCGSGKSHSNADAAILLCRSLQLGHCPRFELHFRSVARRGHWGVGKMPSHRATSAAPPNLLGTER